MKPLPKFLIIDDVEENRFLISKTLLRKFPGALVQECEETAPALAAAQHDRLAAIIVHRSTELSGPAVIAKLRRLNPSVPIVMVSGRESCPEAIEAGANAFLNYEAWLRIGTVVEDVMDAERAAAHVSKFPFVNVPAEPEPATE